MKFIELYCEKAKGPVLLNLDHVDFVATGIGDDFHLIVFGYADGKVMVHFKSKDTHADAMRKVANFVSGELKR